MSAKREEGGPMRQYPPRIDPDLYQAVIPALDIALAVEEQTTPPKAPKEQAPSEQTSTRHSTRQTTGATSKKIVNGNEQSKSKGTDTKKRDIRAGCVEASDGLAWVSDPDKLDPQKADEYLVFTRNILEQTAIEDDKSGASWKDADGDALMPLETDEMALDYLQKNNWDFALAKCRLMAEIGAKKEDAYILAKEKGYTKQKEFDRSSLVGSFSSAREKARYKYPLYYHDKTSTDVAPISKKPGVEAYKKRSADRAELRKNWTLLYERAGKQVAMLTSGPKGHQRASFQEVLSILSDASLLPILELPPGDTAFKKGEESIEILKSAQLAGRKSLALLHDALNTTISGPSEIEELKSLLKTLQSQPMQLEEEALLEKVIDQAEVWKTQADDIINNHGKIPLARVAQLVRDADNIPVSLPQKSILVDEIKACKLLQTRLAEAFPQKGRYTVYKKLEVLQELHQEAEGVAIQLPETAILAEVVGRAERWMKEASAALETSPDLKKLQALHSEASHMQVDLTETSALLWQKVEQAQKWVEKVRKALPRKNKTRHGVGVERVDLNAARNLLSEGEGMKVDLRELGDFQGLLETAQVWVQRVREALDDATDEAGLQALENLLQEADNIPVEMEEHKILAAEIQARKWGIKVQPILDKDKVSIEELEKILAEAADLRAGLGVSFKLPKGWKIPQEVEARRKLESISEWVIKSKKFLNTAGTALRRNATYSAMKEFIESAEETLGTLDPRLQLFREACEQVKEWYKDSSEVLQKCGIESSFGRTGNQDQGSVPMGGSEDVANKKASGDEIEEVEEEGLAKAEIGEIAECISKGDALAIDLEEVSELKRLHSEVNAWMDRAASACPKRISKRKGRAKAGFEDVANMIHEGKKLPVDVSEEIGKMEEQVELTIAWQEKVREQLLVLAKDGLEDLRLFEEEEAELAKEEEEEASADEANEASADKSVSEVKRERDRVKALEARTTKFQEMVEDAGDIIINTPEEAMVLKHQEAHEWFQLASGVLRYDYDLISEAQIIDFEDAMKKGQALLDHDFEKDEEQCDGILMKTIKMWWAKLSVWNDVISTAKAWLEKMQKVIGSEKVKIETMSGLVEEAEGFGFELDHLRKLKQELQRAKSIQTRSIAALEDGGLLTLSALRSLIGEGDKCRANLEEIKTLKKHVTEATKWIQKVQKANPDEVEMMSELAREMETIRVDLSEHLSIIQKALCRCCVCRGMEEGDLIECTSCNEKYHTDCMKGNAVLGSNFVCPRCLMRDSFKRNLDQSISIITEYLSQVQEGLKEESIAKEEKGIGQERENEVAIAKQADDQSIQGAEDVPVALKGDEVLADSEKGEEVLREKAEENQEGVTSSDLLEEPVVEAPAQEIAEAVLDSCEESESLLAKEDLTSEIMEKDEMSMTVASEITERGESGMLEEDKEIATTAPQTSEKLDISQGPEEPVDPAKVQMKVKAFMRKLLVVIREAALKQGEGIKILGREGGKAYGFADVERLSRQDEDLKENADVRAAMRMLEVMLWCCKGLWVYRKRSSIKEVQELNKKYSKLETQDEQIKAAVSSLVSRAADWTRRAKAAIRIPRSNINLEVDLDLCRKLLNERRYIPLQIKEEVRLSSVVEEEGKRYCHCRGFWDGTFMIECSRCHEWFHGRCIGVSKQDGTMSKNKSYHCPTCSKKGAFLQVDEKMDDESFETDVLEPEDDDIVADTQSFEGMWNLETLEYLNDISKDINTSNSVFNRRKRKQSTPVPLEANAGLSGEGFIPMPQSKKRSAVPSPSYEGQSIPMDHVVKKPRPSYAYGNHAGGHPKPKPPKGPPPQSAKVEVKVKKVKATKGKNGSAFSTVPAPPPEEPKGGGPDQPKKRGRKRKVVEEQISVDSIGFVPMQPHENSKPKKTSKHKIEPSPEVPPGPPFAYGRPARPSSSYLGDPYHHSEYRPPVRPPYYSNGVPYGSNNRGPIISNVPTGRSDSAYPAAYPPPKYPPHLMNQSAGPSYMYPPSPHHLARPPQASYAYGNPPANYASNSPVSPGATTKKGKGKRQDQVAVTGPGGAPGHVELGSLPSK